MYTTKEIKKKPGIRGQVEVAEAQSVWAPHPLTRGHTGRKDITDMEELPENSVI